LTSALAKRVNSGWKLLPGLYDHEMTLLDGSRNVSLSEYSGRVVLLVNVATY
jgi:glutathione peroxidase-family protein